MDRFEIWPHHEVSVEPCDIINKSLKNKVPVCFRKQKFNVADTDACRP